MCPICTTVPLTALQVRFASDYINNDGQAFIVRWFQAWIHHLSCCALKREKAVTVHEHGAVFANSTLQQESRSWRCLTWPCTLPEVILLFQLKWSVWKRTVIPALWRFTFVCVFFSFRFKRKSLNNLSTLSNDRFTRRKKHPKRDWKPWQEKPLSSPLSTSVFQWLRSRSRVFQHNLPLDFRKTMHQSDKKRITPGSTISFAISSLQHCRQKELERHFLCFKCQDVNSIFSFISWSATLTFDPTVSSLLEVMHCFERGSKSSGRGFVLFLCQ